jgi:hypothetical protein
MTHRTVEIQFVGGPYDGHNQAFTDPPIIERLPLPVNKNMLPLLERKEPGPPAPTLTVARYELRKVEGKWQYHFVEAVSMKEIDLEAIRETIKKNVSD